MSSAPAWNPGYTHPMTHEVHPAKPRSQTDPIALLEDIRAIPHIPEFLALRRTAQATKALQMLICVLLLWVWLS